LRCTFAAYGTRLATENPAYRALWHVYGRCGFELHGGNHLVGGESDIDAVRLPTGDGSTDMGDAIITELLK
jgi:hypothetical protein